MPTPISRVRPIAPTSRDDSLQILPLQVDQRFVQQNPSVVDQHVDWSDCARKILNRLPIRLIVNKRAERLGPAGDKRFQSFRIAISNMDDGAKTGKQRSGRTADTA
jgi:hypothetical protein